MSSIEDISGHRFGALVAVETHAVLVVQARGF